MPTTTVIDVTMPQLGESVTEGTVGEWLKQPGDTVEKYDPLVEIESDKASAELPSPLAGTLAEILVEPGTTVPTGTALCRIEEADSGTTAAGESSRSADPVSAPAPANGSSHLRHDGAIRDEAAMLRTRSSPFVRRVAEEHGIDISQVQGSGAGGRVTKRDVLAAVEERRGTDRVAAPPATNPPATLSADPSASSGQALVSASVEHDHEPMPVHEGDEVVPVSSMRRAIAENVTRSAFTAPHATTVMEVDMTAAVAWRTAHKVAFREREGVDLTYLPIVLKGVALALRDHPRLNAVWDDTRIIHRREINIGVAVALEDGLVVPVIRNADRLNLAGLAHMLADLAGKARAGSLTPDEMHGGTFTVNNPGTFGSLVSTPILVPPQVGILSTEAIVRRPVVVDDMIGIRSIMNLCLSIDHRALDGLAATRFLRQLRDWLEAVDDDRLS